MISLIIAPYLFIWKFFGSGFNNNMSKLRDIREFKHVSTKMILLIFLCVVVLVSLALYKHSLFPNLQIFDQFVENLKREPPYLFRDRYFTAIAVVITKFFDLWLHVFNCLSNIFIMTICLCLYQEYKFLYIDLSLLVKSGKIYSSVSFMEWRKKYQEVAILVEDFDEHMKLSIGYTILFSCTGIMGALYHTTVSCNGAWITVIWILKFLSLLVVVMIPGVALNKQVMNLFLLLFDILSPSLFNRQDLYRI